MSGLGGWGRGPGHTRYHFFEWPKPLDSKGRRVALCQKARAVELEIVFEPAHRDHRCDRCTFRFRRIPFSSAPDTPASAAAKGEFARDIGDMAERILGGGDQ